jgi:hypothetical protein
MPRKLLTMSTWHVRLVGRASLLQRQTYLSWWSDGLDAYKHAMGGSLSTDRGINAAIQGKRFKQLCRLLNHYLGQYGNKAPYQNIYALSAIFRPAPLKVLP